MGKPSDLVQGTLDLLILRTISLEPMHGWAVAKRIQQVSGEVLQVQQGSLYPALPDWSAGMDQGSVGRKRNRTAGEVLFAYSGWPQQMEQELRIGAGYLRRSIWWVEHV